MKTDSAKQQTIRSYDQYAEKYDAYFEESFQKNIRPFADEFLAYLKGPKILDLGSGPGIHAVYFKQTGFDVLCIDLSEKFIDICRKKGLNAEVMDIEKLTLPDNSFDGIWAYASLLHLKKENFPKVIASIATLLKKGGIFGLAMKEGRSGGI